MVLLENKIAIFKKIVFSNLRDSLKEKLDQEKANYEETIKKKKEELDEAKKAYIQKKEKQADLKINEVKSVIAEEKRVMHLQKFNELVDQLVKDLLDKCTEFTQDPAYLTHLKKSFKNVCSSIHDEKKEKYIVALRKEDKEKLQKDFLKIAQKEDIQLTFAELDDKQIGGFILWDEGKNYMFDKSLRKSIEKNHYEIGKLLYDTLDQEVNHE